MENQGQILFNQLALDLAEKEGGNEQQNLGQINELLKLFLLELKDLSIEEIISLIGFVS